MTGPGCGWSKISRVRAPYDNLDPAVKPLQSPESAVYIMDSLLDKRIAQLFGLSRRAAQEAVRQGQVDVNGQPCLDPALEIEPQAHPVYHANRPRAGTTARRLHVLYEDPQILIV